MLYLVISLIEWLDIFYDVLFSYMEPIVSLKLKTIEHSAFLFCGVGTKTEWSNLLLLRLKTVWKSVNRNYTTMGHSNI